MLLRHRVYELDQRSEDPGVEHYRRCRTVGAGLPKQKFDIGEVGAGWLPAYVLFERAHGVLTALSAAAAFVLV